MIKPKLRTTFKGNPGLGGDVGGIAVADQFAGKLLNDTPISCNVMQGSPGRGHRKPDHVLALERGRDGVHLAGAVQLLEQLLGVLVALPLQPEHHHPEMPLGRDLKSRISLYQGLELLRQPHTLTINIITIKKESLQVLSYFSNVCLQPFDSIVSNDKPQFQGSKSLAQWNLPMLILKNNNMRAFLMHLRRFFTM